MAEKGGGGEGRRRLSGDWVINSFLQSQRFEV
jgi:hypothetical protein